MKLSQIFDERKPGTKVRNLGVAGYEQWEDLNSMVLGGHMATTFFVDPHWESSNPRTPLEVLIDLKKAASEILIKVSETDSKYGMNLDSWVSLGKSLKEAESVIKESSPIINEVGTGKIRIESDDRF